MYSEWVVAFCGLYLFFIGLHLDSLLVIGIGLYCMVASSVITR
jgi:hypothetical protein